MAQHKHFSWDGLLPKEMAILAEDIGIAKAREPFIQMSLLAILAGAFIALGAVFSTVVLAGNGHAQAIELPFGLIRLFSGLAFSLGLILVIVAGAELFTGNNLLVMAYVSRRISLLQLLRNWIIVYLANFVGALLTAVIMFATEQYKLGDGSVGAVALSIAQQKTELSFMTALTRGVLCNALVCLAVWLCYSAHTVTDKILAIIFPITAFVASGFEHSVANMYFIPIGLLIKTDADFLAHLGVNSKSYQSLNFERLFMGNLLPVTIGNMIGGVFFVGIIYWIAYRYKGASSAK